MVKGTSSTMLFVFPHYITPIHEVVVREVAIAVRIVMAMSSIFFQTSFFMVFVC